MHNPTWSDNICTVGWTSIHAWLLPEDIAALRAISPDHHHFRETLFVGRDGLRGIGKDIRSPRRLAAWMDRVSPYHKNGAPFYFSFPEEFLPEVLAYCGLSQ